MARDKTASSIKKKVAFVKGTVDKDYANAKKTIGVAENAVDSSMREVDGLRTSLETAKRVFETAEAKFIEAEKEVTISAKKQEAVYVLIDRFETDLDVLLAED